MSTLGKTLSLTGAAILIGVGLYLGWFVIQEII